jgi:Ca2+-binding EF-hand superfamily protein
MENNIKEKIDRIVEYVSQSVSLWRRLEKKKVSLDTAKLAFAKIDSKRKGYLDLTNVYELCGEVTENQLFHAFKWLDVSKSGDITLSDI